MRKFLFLTILFFCLSLGVRGQIVYPTIDLSGLPEATTAQSLRYWFDDDIGTNVQTSNTLDGSSVTIGTTSLVEGIHILHYQVVDNNGLAGIPVSSLFLKIGGALTAKSLRYWFDNDPNTVKTTTSIPSGATTIDASGLVEGIHTVHYQIVDNNGTVGIPVSKMFMKLGAKTITATAIQYWFDENDAIIKESAIDVDNLTTTVDASSLGYGKHILNYQLKLSDGTLSPAATATFETTQTLRGDANNDGKVNVTDIVVIQIFMGDNTKPIHGANADVYGGNDDGYGDNAIDQNDVEAVKDIIMTPKE